MAQSIDKNRARKEQVFKKLRREILAARLKVTLDEQLNRKTSPTVKRLSEMKLPPIARSVNVLNRNTPKVDIARSSGRVQYVDATRNPHSQRSIAS
ncbi:hypothetical protein J2790_002013 [Paenarthrobacter nicotinovorans]|nr:hypothetical protein [Paenarthrobacter nicotinovorans]SCZ55465.1 hypothetical protein SAMN02799638_01750 [Arthrobacter sp. UNCCL28]